MFFKDKLFGYRIYVLLILLIFFVKNSLNRIFQDNLARFIWFFNLPNSTLR